MENIVLKTFKDFVEDKKYPELQVVDFASNRPKKNMPELQVVDFASNRPKKRKLKSLKETIHGPTNFHHHTLFPDHEDAESHDKHYKDKVGPLDDELHNHYKPKEEHKDSISHYTDEGSTSMNRELFDSKGKHDKDSRHAKHIEDLHDATKEHAAPKSFHVYSGLHSAPQGGETHVHHGFMSTSIDNKTASAFAKNFNGRHDEEGNYHVDKHMLKLKIPKGSKHGHYVGRNSTYGHGFGDLNHEHEFILGKGKRIKIHPEPEIHKKSDTGITIHHHIWHGEIVDD